MLHIYHYFHLERLLAAKQSDLDLKTEGPGSESQQPAGGTRDKNDISVCRWHRRQPRSDVLPGRHSPLCADSWTQPTAGIRDSKQQEPSTEDSSALPTAVLGLGRCQAGQPHPAQNLPDAIQSLLRAGNTPRCAHATAVMALGHWSGSPPASLCLPGSAPPALAGPSEPSNPKGL